MAKEHEPTSRSPVAQSIEQCTYVGREDDVGVGLALPDFVLALTSRVTPCREATSPGMNTDDPRARVRERRRRAYIDELIPRVRRLNPHWTDDEVIEMAESMADVRLLDEEIG